MTWQDRAHAIIKKVIADNEGKRSQRRDLLKRSFPMFKRFASVIGFAVLGLSIMSGNVTEDRTSAEVVPDKGHALKVDEPIVTRDVSSFVFLVDALEFVKTFEFVTSKTRSDRALHHVKPRLSNVDPPPRFYARLSA